MIQRCVKNTPFPFFLIFLYFSCQISRSTQVMQSVPIMSTVAVRSSLNHAFSIESNGQKTKAHHNYDKDVHFSQNPRSSSFIISIKQQLSSLYFGNPPKSRETHSSLVPHPPLSFLLIYFPGEVFQGSGKGWGRRCYQILERKQLFQFAPSLESCSLQSNGTLSRA